MGNLRVIHKQSCEHLIRRPYVLIHWWTNDQLEGSWRAVFRDLKEQDSLIEADWCSCSLGAKGMTYVFGTHGLKGPWSATSTSRSSVVLFKVDWLKDWHRTLVCISFISDCIRAMIPGTKALNNVLQFVNIMKLGCWKVVKNNLFMYMLIFCCIYSIVQSSLLWNLSWLCHRFLDPNLHSLVTWKNNILVSSEHCLGVCVWCGARKHTNLNIPFDVYVKPLTEWYYLRTMLEGKNFK